MVRSATLDYARLLAAIGIILFHVGGPGARLGYAALPFFIILLVFLAFPAAGRQDLRSYAATRFRRLMGPWAVWSLIYLCLKLAEVVVIGKPLETEFAPWMLLAGPAVHLWFLPFALAACLAIWPLAQVVGRLPPAGRILLAAAATGLAVILTGLAAGRLHYLPVPFGQWLHGAPAVALGAAFALAANTGPNRAGALAVLLVALAGLVLAGWPAGSRLLALAGGAMVLCLAWPLPASDRARRMADLSLTLYLAHPMVIAVLLRVTPLPERSLAMALAAVAGTLLLAAALHQWAAGRWMPG